MALLQPHRHHGTATLTPEQAVKLKTVADSLDVTVAKFYARAKNQSFSTAEDLVYKYLRGLAANAKNALICGVCPADTYETLVDYGRGMKSCPR
jgi:hypothetical protein